MAFIKAVSSGFRNYANFSGRANRREFWNWLGFVIIIWLVMLWIDASIVGPMRGFAAYESGAGTWLANLWLLICLLPTVSLIVRRVHDHGFSGYWALTILPLIWWLFAKGSKKPNRFGD